MLRPKTSQLFFAFLLSLLAGIAHYLALFSTLDLSLYDSAHQLTRFEAAEDILIVDIDEQSMDKLGAWPWSRNLHAQLLDRLTELGVHDVAFDVIFSEESAVDPEGDRAFSEAISRHGGVVLPLFIGSLSSNGAMLEVPPAPIFYQAKPSIGHVHIGCDADSICRSVYLKEGLGDPHWPHISLALLQQQRFQKKLPGTRSSFKGEYSSKLIYRDYQNYFKFPRTELGFSRVSYWDIMTGYYSPEQFDGYTVFVGSTVAGLGDDEVSTPVGAMPGVVVNAIIYQQLRNGDLIREVQPLEASIFIGFFGFICLLLLSRLSPVYFLICTVGSLFLLYGLMIFFLSTLAVWVPIASLCLLIIVYYPLWNWFKLQLALNFLKNQLSDLAIEGASIQSLFSKKTMEKDFVESSDDYGIEVVTHTLRRLSSVYLFVEEHRLIIENTLASIKDAVVLAEEDGTLVLSNKVAKNILDLESRTVLNDLSTRLSMLSNNKYEGWSDYVESVALGKRLDGVEIRLSEKFDSDELDENEKILFCRGELSVFETPNFPRKKMLIFTFSDISPLKRAERLRIDTLNFLSHDLRAPMVSILALISNIRSGRNQNSFEENLEKIKSYTESNLSYSESILQLGRAEEVKIESFGFVDIHTVVDSAYYSVHDFAKSKNIDLKIEREDSDFWVNGDAELLERAIVNLISNGVKYSESSEAVIIGIKADNKMVNISVSDSGAGIDKSDLSFIFSRYKRGGSAQGNLGAGLGLYFVKTVAQKHLGTILVESEIGQGSCFTLSLPMVERDYE